MDKVYCKNCKFCSNNTSVKIISQNNHLGKCTKIIDNRISNEYNGQLESGELKMVDILENKDGNCKYYECYTPLNKRGMIF